MGGIRAVPRTPMPREGVCAPKQVCAKRALWEGAGKVQVVTPTLAVMSDTMLSYCMFSSCSTDAAHEQYRAMSLEGGAKKEVSWCW